MRLTSGSYQYWIIGAVTIIICINTIGIDTKFVLLEEWPLVQFIQESLELKSRLSHWSSNYQHLYQNHWY